jgi:hypothetical protein
MTEPETTLPRSRFHQIVVALIAILVAVALVLNYLLW